MLAPMPPKGNATRLAYSPEYLRDTRPVRRPVGRASRLPEREGTARAGDRAQSADHAHRRGPTTENLRRGMEASGVNSQPIVLSSIQCAPLLLCSKDMGSSPRLGEAFAGRARSGHCGDDVRASWWQGTNPGEADSTRRRSGGRHLRPFRKRSTRRSRAGRQDGNAMGIFQLFERHGRHSLSTNPHTATP